MKKLIVLLSALTIFFTLTLSAGAIDISVDGVKIGFNDSMGYPFIENGRTLVPLRASMEAIGAEVSWDSEQNCAIVKKGATPVVCYVNEACIYRNGTKIPNEAATQIRDSRTYLPIRAVAEAFDATVGWDGSVTITTGAAGNLIYSIENSGIHVSNIWKHWEDALATKSSGNYSSAIEKFKTLAPDFISKHDGNSNAMLYKHLGECYSALVMNEEASACFKREAQLWESVGKTQETIDANRRALLINSSVQMYAKTYNNDYKTRKDFGEKYEPANGLYIGAYAEGDRAVHDPWSNTKFYINDFPALVGRDMSAYLLYMPSTTPLSNYQSHIDIAIKKNKIIQLAIEPVNFFQTQPNDSTYIKLAQDMEASGAKFFLRLASEMNDTSCPWYTDNYNLYIEKFRIVADIFHTYAPSVPVVWSPNFYPANNIHLYYPGDKYVDYVGISSYMNHQPETDPLGQGVDRNRWSEQLDTICSLYAHKKPIMVSEGGASYMDYNTWGDITAFSSAQLYDFYTYLPIKYPSVKAVYIFDNDRERYRFSLSNNQQYLDAFKRGTKSEQYLATPDEKANLPQYYELGTNVAVEATVVEISSFIKTPANDTSYVVYNIYGTDVGTSYAIPYSVTIDFSPYKGTTVPLKAMAFNQFGAKVAEKALSKGVDEATKKVATEAATKAATTAATKAAEKGVVGFVGKAAEEAAAAGSHEHSGSFPG